MSKKSPIIQVHGVMILKYIFEARNVCEACKLQVASPLASGKLQVASGKVQARVLTVWAEPEACGLKLMTAK